MRWMRILLTGVVVGFAALWFGCDWIMNGLPVSEGKLKALKPGMSQEEVRLVLGRPSSVTSSTNWVYSKGYLWSFIQVRFGPDEKFDHYFVDD